jgi:hypothetical protein
MKYDLFGRFMQIQPLGIQGAVFKKPRTLPTQGVVVGVVATVVDDGTTVEPHVTREAGI